MNVSGIFELFSCGISHGLKWPKVRLQAADGQAVVLKLNGIKSKYQGSIAVSNGGEYGSADNKYFGRLDANGTWVPARDSSPAIVELLEKLSLNPAEVAASYGKLTGNCCFCQIALRDARSTAVGYGPICADHFGLPWGSDFVATPETREEDLQREIFADRVVIREAVAESNPFAAVEFCETNDTPEALLNSPETPFWAKDVIRVALTKDVCDASGVFAVLAKSFEARAKKILGQS